MLLKVTLTVAMWCKSILDILSTLWGKASPGNLPNALSVIPIMLPQQEKKMTLCPTVVRLSDTAAFLRILHWCGWNMPCRAHWAKGLRAIRGCWWGKDYSKKIRVEEQREDRKHLLSLRGLRVTTGIVPYFKTLCLKPTRRRQLKILLHQKFQLLWVICFLDKKNK